MSDSITVLDDETDDDYEPGELTEADVGTVLDCGCIVTRANIPCGGGYDDEGYQNGHDYPDTGCGDCRFGVPAVYHDEDTCKLYQPASGDCTACDGVGCGSCVAGVVTADGS